MLLVKFHKTNWVIGSQILTNLITEQLYFSGAHNVLPNVASVKYFIVKVLGYRLCFLPAGTVFQPRYVSTYDPFDGDGGM